MKSLSVTIQMKATEQYFPVVLFITSFAVHYEKIRIHLREMATNSAKIHSLAPKNEHLRVAQIQ